MKIVKTIQELTSLLQEYRKQEQKIGFVPTMGYLHEGHMSLVAHAKSLASVVVMSIFVNPTQFGPGEDFEKYPRNMERDSELAEARGVDVLFVPEVEDIYPNQPKTTVSVSDVTSRLCGASRPGHFDGVATVVCKLFNIVQPHFAFFGMKDAQQVAVIQQMVQDLNIPVEIVPCPIVREKDGLALSSRNVYLNEEERRQALVLSQALEKAEQEFIDHSSPAEIREKITALIQSKPLATIDYVEILSYPSLEPINVFDQSSSFIVALAVKFGKTRLIDNKMIRGREQHV